MYRRTITTVLFLSIGVVVCGQDLVTSPIVQIGDDLGSCNRFYGLNNGSAIRISGLVWREYDHIWMTPIFNAGCGKISGLWGVILQESSDADTALYRLGNGSHVLDVEGRFFNGLDKELPNGRGFPSEGNFVILVDHIVSSRRMTEAECKSMVDLKPCCRK
jgi:hypothetical protein